MRASFSRRCGFSARFEGARVPARGAVAMLFYSLPETLLLIAAAIAIDWIAGDPKWPTHPVIYIGRLIKKLERLLRPEGAALSPGQLRLRGVLLAAATIAAS